MSQASQAAGRRKFIGRPPRFRKGEEGLERSPYYWWWQFLRRNDAYINCCKAGGTDSLAALYRDFGDVRSDDFKKWWRNVGEHIFSEPPVPTSIQLVPTPAALTQLDLLGCLVVTVPLTLSKRTLKRRFNELLRKHHLGRRGGNRFNKSLARYPFAAKPVTKALGHALKVYDLRIEHPDWTLWQIGQEAGISTDYRVDPKLPPKQTVDERIYLAVSTSRLLKRARGYIKNVGKGVFPKK